MDGTESQDNFKNAWQHSGAAIKNKRFVPEKFVHVHVAMKVKFALEQPSSTGVGHGLARSCTCYYSS